MTPSSFRVTFVDGVTLDKWRRRWIERVPATRLDLVLVADDVQADALRSGEASMGFVRDLAEHEREGLHHIPLYEEVPVVVVQREHPVAAYDEIPLGDLRDETVLDDPALSTRLKVATVAAGTGIVVLPMSVARTHHRKDVVAVPVVGADASRIGLAWRTDLDDPLVDVFVGIVRGRTENSSRGSTAPTSTRKQQQPSAKRPTGRPGRRSGRGHRG